MADLAVRRAGVSQVMVPERWAAQSSKPREDDVAIDAPSEPQEMIYDGANATIRIAGRWTGFFLGDPGGPRSPNDPLWPLDALLGAHDQRRGDRT